MHFFTRPVAHAAVGPSSSELLLAGACDISHIDRVLHTAQDLTRLTEAYGMHAVTKMLHSYEVDVLAHRIPTGTVNVEKFMQDNCANDFHIARFKASAEGIRSTVKDTLSWLKLPTDVRAEIGWKLDRLVTESRFPYTGWFNPSPSALVPGSAPKLASHHQDDPLSGDSKTKADHLTTRAGHFTGDPSAYLKSKWFLRFL